MNRRIALTTLVVADYDEAIAWYTGKLGFALLEDIDQGHKQEARTYIAMVKVQMAKVLHDVVQRALHLHGALGCSNEMPLMRMWAGVPIMGIADGPTEVHKVTVAKAVLKQYEPYEGLWPNDFLPTRVEEARAQFAEFLEHEVGNQ